MRISASHSGPEDHDPESELGERLGAFHQRLQLLLHHYAGRAIRAQVEIDDLVQEVYLRSVAQPGSIPPAEPGDAALWRYLARIARNAVIDVARSIRALKRDGATSPLTRSDWSHAGPVANQLLAKTAGPATKLIAKETSEQLLDQYRALTPEHRRVLGLRQFEGLSAAETAARMGRSETAIHSLYRRALAAWELGAEGTITNSPRLRDESESHLRPDRHD